MNTQVFFIVIVEPAGSFVQNCTQTRPMGRYSEKWPISFVYASNSPITAIKAIVSSSRWPALSSNVFQWYMHTCRGKTQAICSMLSKWKTFFFWINWRFDSSLSNWGPELTVKIPWKSSSSFRFGERNLAPFQQDKMLCGCRVFHTKLNAHRSHWVPCGDSKSSKTYHLTIPGVDLWRPIEKGTRCPTEGNKSTPTCVVIIRIIIMVFVLVIVVVIYCYCFVRQC